MDLRYTVWLALSAALTAATSALRLENSAGHLVKAGMDLRYVVWLALSAALTAASALRLVGFALRSNYVPRMTSFSAARLAGLSRW